MKSKFLSRNKMNERLVSEEAFVPGRWGCEALNFCIKQVNIKGQNSILRR